MQRMLWNETVADVLKYSSNPAVLNRIHNL